MQKGGMRKRNLVLSRISYRSKRVFFFLSSKNRARKFGKARSCFFQKTQAIALEKKLATTAVASATAAAAAICFIDWKKEENSKETGKTM